MPQDSNKTQELVGKGQRECRSKYILTASFGGWVCG